MTDRSPAVEKDVEKLFSEVLRVLKRGTGKYILVSLAQEHVLDKVIQWFTSGNAILLLLLFVL